MLWHPKIFKLFSNRQGFSVLMWIDSSEMGLKQPGFDGLAKKIKK